MAEVDAESVDLVELRRELARCRAENQALRQQVDSGVQTELRLLAVQERLNEQLRLFQQLYEHGKEFGRTFDADAMAGRMLEFAVQDLNFQRAVVLLHEPDCYRPVAWDGYFDEREVSGLRAVALPPEGGIVAALTQQGDRALYGSTAQGPLDPVRQLFAVDEFALLALRTDEPAPLGLFLVGNTRDKGIHHTRVAPGAAAIALLSNLATLAAAALRNARERRLLEQKVAQRTEELSRANADLRQLDQVKTQFFSNVSHELRTPLTLSLLPLQQLLARGDLEPWIATRLAVVRDNQLRLLKLINELLDFSRLEAGRGTALYRRFDVGRALRYYLGTLEAAAEERRLRLELRLPEEAVELYVDSEKFEKIVMNLLSNAYKFTPDGGAVIVSVEQANEVVRIAVEDTGVGIPRDELERIFERFSQVDSSARRRYAGTGIGLALVKEFMKLHGGDVTVESELGRGSRFLLHFPRGNAHLDPGCIAADVVAQEAMEVHPEELVAFARDRVVVVERTAAPGSAGESPVSMPAAGGPRHRVMVVDDLPAMRQMIASFLEPYYDVTVASDGQEALALAQSVVPDLIVSDVMMPQMTGYELCAALRQRPGPLASVPVILVTARAEMTLKLEGLQHGADDYLIKPFNAEELMARIRNLIKVRSQERQLAQTLAELARKEQALREDLEQAYRFQQSMLPQIASSPRRGLHVAALYRPAYIVGGDIFDVCMLGPDRVRVFIADATGHGVQASLRTMVIKSTYDRLKSQCTRPVELLDALNQEILRSGRAEICFSAVCFDLVVREDGGLLRYSSAGHPPIICVAGGSERLLAHRTSILGHSPQIRLAEGETMLEPGARVFGYTDGLCEQQNARGRLFGERRLVRSLADADVSLEETVERAVVTVQQFADKTVLDDDVSLVALEMTRAGTEPAAPVRG